MLLILDNMVQQKESVLLTRWLAEFHRTSIQWKRVRLGIPANPAEAKLYSVLMRWADAILFYVTPEFVQYANWPVKLILLSPVMDLGIAQICTKKGITYEVYKPVGWL